MNDTPDKSEPTVADEIRFVDDPYALGPDAGEDSESTAEWEEMAEDPPTPASAPTPESDDDALPNWRQMGSHLEELRRRIVISLSVFVPLFALGLYLYQPLWRIVIMPLDRAAPHLTRFQALGPSDGLIMAMRIALAFALFLSLPVWLGQVWCFIAPGLTAREKRYLHLALGSGGLLFCIGAAIAYFAGVPLALEFLLPFNQSLAGWENSFTGRDYVDFIVTCCAGFGIAFELPLAMLTLGWFGLLTPEALRAYWRPIVLVVFILAAVFTPPDPFTQLMLALPMLILFAIGYQLVKWVHTNR